MPREEHVLCWNVARGITPHEERELSVRIEESRWQASLVVRKVINQPTENRVPLLWHDLNQINILISLTCSDRRAVAQYDDARFVRTLGLLQT
jgi:hypothetical protein